MTHCILDIKDGQARVGSIACNYSAIFDDCRISVSRYFFLIKMNFADRAGLVHLPSKLNDNCE